MKPIKHRGKPKTTSSPICKYSTPPGPWAKSDKEKAELFAEHLSDVFSPHNNDLDQEVERDLITPIQSQECLQTFTLKEIHQNVKSKKGTRSRPYYCQNVERTTKGGALKLHVYIQCHTTTQILA